MTPAEACGVLISHSALSWAELMVLEAAAAGEETVLELGRREAAGQLARWRGPLPGLRLVPLAHWGTAIVRGGAPYDPEQRREIAKAHGNLFAEAPEYDPRRHAHLGAPAGEHDPDPDYLDPEFDDPQE